MSKNSTTKKRTNRPESALEKMTPGLRKEYDKILAELANSTLEDAKIRYRLGALVNAIEGDPEKYGKRGVAQLAAALGYDKSLLYRHGKVAACWPTQEFNALLRQTGATGLPLSFSHMQFIAMVTSEKSRKKYIGAVLHEGLSVRKLKRRLEPISKRVPQDVAASPDVARALSGLQSTSENWLERMHLLEAQVLPALENTTPSPELLPKYEQTLAQQKELAARLGSLIERLSAWIGPEVEEAERHPAKADDAGAHAQLAEAQEAPSEAA